MIRADAAPPADSTTARHGPWYGRMAGAATAATVLVGAASLYRELRDGVLVPRWQASQFWVTYEHGFVRRGLPGQIASILTGGAPTSGAVTTLAVALVAMAASGFAVVTWLAVRMAASRPSGVLLVALLAASPFTFSLLAQDIGRYDTVGVAAAVVITVAALHLRAGIVPFVAAVALLVAVASSEFLAAFLAPLAIVAMRRAGCRPIAIAAAALPGVLVAVGSLAASPSASTLRAFAADAHAARPDIPQDGASTAIAAIGQGAGTAWANLAEMSPSTLPLLTLILGACYLLASWLAWVLLGRPAPASFWFLAAVYAAAAVALSVIGIDYRRWWALAFVAAVATVLVLARGNDRPRGDSRPLPSPLIAGLVLALSVGGQLVPVSASAWDPAATTHIVISE